MHRTGDGNPAGVIFGVSQNVLDLLACDGRLLMRLRVSQKVASSLADHAVLKRAIEAMRRPDV